MVVLLQSIILYNWIDLSVIIFLANQLASTDFLLMLIDTLISQYLVIIVVLITKTLKLSGLKLREIAVLCFVIRSIVVRKMQPRWSSNRSEEIILFLSKSSTIHVNEEIIINVTRMANQVDWFPMNDKI